MGDVDLVHVRFFDFNGREVKGLVRDSAPDRWLTAADVRKILGDEPPCVAYDDSGPNGALIFSADTDYATGPLRTLSKMLAEQLRTAIRRAAAVACPAESFPEPGCAAEAADVDTDDFAEPVGGEFVRILREEVAHLDALRAKAERSADVIYGGWRPGERFVIGPKSDLPLFYAACHLWAGLIDRTGRVIDRVLIDNGGGYGDHALLVQIDGRTERVVVRVGVMNACAKKVMA